MTLHRDINLLMSSFVIRQTGAAFLSGHYGYAVCGLQHFMFFLFGYKQCFHLKNIMNNVRHNFLPFLSGVICWKPVGCWWQTLRVKLNLLFAKCLWQENIQNKHSSHISITMGSENKEEKVWLVVEMRHLDGLPVNVCLSVCLSAGWGGKGMLSFPAGVPPLCLTSGLNARQILSYDFIHCKRNKDANIRHWRDQFHKEISKW